MPDINYPTVFITSAAALCAAYIGARLARDSEYEKWFRQERTVAIAEYLRQLHTTRTAASDVYFSGNDATFARSIAVGETFLPLEKFYSILALYLSPDAKTRLRTMMNELFGELTDDKGPHSRSGQIKQLMESIQALAEDEHKRPPPPNPDGWKVLTYRLLGFFKRK